MMNGSSRNRNTAVSSRSERTTTTTTTRTTSTTRQQQQEDADENNENDHHDHNRYHRYQVGVTIRFVFLTILATCLLSFCIGRATRHALFTRKQQQQQRTQQHQSERQYRTTDNNGETYREEHQSESAIGSTRTTHPPFVPPSPGGRRATSSPYRRYHFKTFIDNDDDDDTIVFVKNDVVVMSSASWVAPSEVEMESDNDNMMMSSTTCSAAQSSSTTNSNNNDDENDEDDDSTVPAEAVCSSSETGTELQSMTSAQQQQQPPQLHIMVDITNMNSTFLLVESSSSSSSSQQEEQEQHVQQKHTRTLATVLLEIINKTVMTTNNQTSLLSYHCYDHHVVQQQQQPPSSLSILSTTSWSETTTTTTTTKVTCIGIMSNRQHITLHSWPNTMGVSSLDIVMNVGSTIHLDISNNDGDDDDGNDNDTTTTTTTMTNVLQLSTFVVSTIRQVFGITNNITLDSDATTIEDSDTGKYDDDNDNDSNDNSNSRYYNNNKNNKPIVKWAYKIRGEFPTTATATTTTKDDDDEDDDHDNRSSFDTMTKTDISLYFASDIGYEYKQMVASVETDFQRIDVLDYALNANDMRTYEKHSSFPSSSSSSSLPSHSYHNNNNERRRPDRLVFLDGFLQSTLFDEPAYHEALVHPAMFAHTHPKRVTIVGGGEGATLREVLKHRTVEQVSVIEIDERMVYESRTYLPEWSDCSDLYRSAAWCVDDPRVDMYYEDAHGWFVNRFPDGKFVPAVERFNVIIMDALDPESEIPFAQLLYGNVTMLRSIYNALTPKGVLVMQLGESPDHTCPAETFSRYKNREATTKLLEKAGFESIHTYEESHCGFLAPWSFVVALKRYRDRQSWYANEAQINLNMLWRKRRTKSGANPFRYFDGATMVSYQQPPRSFETVFCRRKPRPMECIDSRYIYNPHFPSVPISSFQVDVSGAGKRAGRGLFAKVDIPWATYIAPEEASRSLRFRPRTYDTVVELYENGPLSGDVLESLEEDDDDDDDDDDNNDEDEVMAASAYTKIRRQHACLYYYLHGYGFTKRPRGELEVEVDSSILTFVNHGCRGKYNVGVETSVTEFSANPSVPIGVEYLNGKSHTSSSTSLYNPVIDRHLGVDGDKSLKTIRKGEEVLDNYLAFVGSEEEWEEDILGLRSICAGQPTEGSVTDYEDTHSYSAAMKRATKDDDVDQE